LKLYNKKQLAEYLGIHRDTLSRLETVPGFPKRITPTCWSIDQVDYWLRHARPFRDLADQAREILKNSVKSNNIFEITGDW
jgi:hypothetical protein